MKNVRQGIRIGAVLQRWEVILSILLLTIMVVNGILSPYFWDVRNLFNTTFNFTEKSIIALSMALVIITGSIDISVGSIVALSSFCMGLVASYGAPVPVIVLVGLLVGTVAGMLNGFLVGYLRIPAIAVTIGTMSFFRGIPQGILGDKAFTTYPEEFAWLGQGYVGGTLVPFQLVVFLALALVVGLVLHYTIFGRMVYAVGRNEVAAVFSGIPAKRVKFAVFTLNGLFSGISSVLLTSRILSTRPNIAQGFELEAITIAVLGGVAITGGFGGIPGVVIASFVIGFIRFGMGLMNVPGRVMNLVTGALLIVAIVIPEFIAFMKRRRETDIVEGGNV
ncbi:ABC-type transporter, integral membrane subunit [Spirochaeta thermophila DSM 6578]|uniref:Autoinducer 2 import system permease protein LsrD n=1 Tax=Winmispira thermophila (strain ATCC 700085 / DSM 6578 / Z-1203) TaxID=869211 RepID=G0GFQ7_WINT7|nr:ABC transporter permease [Spirochaeta thermophila]AEJ61600.1 ABC-type transporter, integral membrane subunit [Spirochaeta thermophila DSM 6578]